MTTCQAGFSKSSTRANCHESLCYLNCGAMEGFSMIEHEKVGGLYSLPLPRPV